MGRCGRVAIVRTGLVLDAKGGALPRMLPAFRLGLGATIGSGHQFLPWIHAADWVALVVWLIESESGAGAFNATAPQPLTNDGFTKTLGRLLKRPVVLRAPEFAMKLALGEMSYLLITGQRALPARAAELGFKFSFPTLEPALQDILGV